MLRQSFPQELTPIYNELENKFEKYSAVGLKQFFDKKLSQHQNEKHPALIYALLEEYCDKHLLKFTPDKLEKYLKKIKHSLPADKLQQHRDYAINAYQLLIDAQLANVDNMPFDLFLLIMGQFSPNDIRKLSTQFARVGKLLKGDSLSDQDTELKRQLQQFWLKKLSNYFPERASQYNDTSKQSYDTFFRLYDVEFDNQPNQQYKLGSNEKIIRNININLKIIICDNNLPDFINLINTHSPDYPSLLTQVCDKHAEAIISRNRKSFFNYLITKLSTCSTWSQVQRSFLLNSAIRLKHKEFVSVLLNNSADCNKPYFGELPLQAAIKAQHYDMVALLLTHHADPNILGGGDQSPLHGAVASKQADIVKLLLENKADPNLATGYHKDTPLHLACQLPDYDIVKLLLEHGANPELSNHWSTDGNLTLLESIKRYQHYNTLEIRQIVALLAIHLLQMHVVPDLKPTQFLLFSIQPNYDKKIFLDEKNKLIQRLTNWLNNPKGTICLTQETDAILSDSTCSMRNIYLSIKEMGIITITKQLSYKHG